MTAEEVLDSKRGELQSFLEGVDIDDCGSTLIEDNDTFLKVYYEGFTPDCWLEVYKNYVDENALYLDKVDDQLMRFAEEELINDWKGREGVEPIDYGWEGSVFYAVFSSE